MQASIGYLALFGFVASVAGFLLATISTGEVGFGNRFGSFLGFVGLGVVVLALILGLLLEGYRRLSNGRADEGPPADSEGEEG